MTDTNTILSRITRTLKRHAPSDRASLSLLILAIGLHLVVDVPVTLRAATLESNPLVLALGWEAWAALKIALSFGLVAAWRHAREHWSVGYVTGLGVIAALPTTANLLVLKGGPTGDLAQQLTAGVALCAAFVYLFPAISNAYSANSDKLKNVAMSLLVVASTMTVGVGVLHISSTPTEAATDSAEMVWNVTFTGQATRKNPSFDVDESGNAYIGTEAPDTIQKISPDGTKEWNVTINNPPVFITHNRGENNVYVYTSGNDVFRIDDADGSKTQIITADVFNTLEASEEYGGFWAADDSDNVRRYDSSGSVVLTTESSSGTNEFVVGPDRFWADVSTSTIDQAYFKDDGTQDYQFDTGSETQSATAAENGNLVVDQDNGGQLIDFSDGSVIKSGIWPTGNNLRLKSYATISDNYILGKGIDSNIVQARDSNGDLVWSLTLPSNNNNQAIAENVGGEQIVWTFDGGDADTATLTKINTGATTEPDVSGQVVDQAGNPIKDATVVGYTSQKNTVEDARNQLDDLSNPIPSTFQDQIDSGMTLMGSNGEFQNTDQNYVGVYSLENINVQPWTDGADLSRPMWRSVPTDKQVALIVGDPTKSDIPVVDEEYDRQVPGRVVSDSVVVERIGPDGSVLDSTTVETEKRAGGGFLDPSSMPFAKFTFDTGIYRVRAQDSSFSYMIKAGSPTAIMDQAVEDTDSSLSEYSQNIKDAISNGDVSRVVTTTDSNGQFGFDVPSGTKVVHVQAYKSSTLVDVQNKDPSKINLSDIRADYSLDTSEGAEDLETQLESFPQGSIYIPSRAYRVEPPDRNVTVRMVEVTMPPLGDLKALQERQQSLLDELRNGSFQDLLGDQLRDINSEELRDLHEELDQLRERNDRIDQRYRELLEQSGLSEVNVDVNETSDDELKTRIRNLQESVRRLQDTIDSEPPQVDAGSESINARFTFDEALDAGDVTVLAHWSNGTTSTVADKFITLDEGIGNAVGAGSTTVQVSDFPLGENDPNAVSFEVLVANEDGIGRSTAAVKNPTFSGDLPDIDSVAVSSLEPGPSDTVEVSLDASDESSFRSVSGATVYGPSGSQVATIDEANVTDGDTFNFTTSGEGRYWVEATIEDSTGAQYTLPFNLRAGNSDKPRKPGIRAKSGPLGTYAVVGDGFTGGDVETTPGGDIEVIGQIEQSADVPNRVHIYLSEIEQSRDSDVQIRLTRGEDRESINNHVFVTVHGKSLTEDALVYRNEDQPITEDSSTRFGRVSTGGNGTVIETYTESNGEVSVDTVNNPSTLDVAIYQFRILTSDIDVPFTTVVSGSESTARGAADLPLPVTAYYATTIAAENRLATREVARAHMMEGSMLTKSHQIRLGDASGYRPTAGISGATAGVTEVVS